MTDLLQHLHAANVEFSLVGGLAAVHYGVTLVTQDIDICARFSRENLHRIEKALDGLHPWHRMTPQRLPLELSDELCARLKNLYLMTDLGVLDCLSEVAGIGNFDQVLAQSRLNDYPFGKINILSIDALIRSKQAMGRDRDIAAVKQLKAIKETSRS